MSTVYVKTNESLESAIRRWKKKVERDNILGDLKKYEAFESPSEKKRRKKKEAIRKIKIQESRARKYERD